MGTLYRYELKKLLSRKVLWIAAGIMILILCASAMTDVIAGNVGELKKSERISGRDINQELLTELQSDGRMDDYPVIKNLLKQCMRTENPGKVDEQALYASRQAANEHEMDSYKLSDAERAYWNKKEAEVKKPFTYQREDGYAALSAFLSQVLGNHSAATAIMVTVLFLSMLNIPEKIRLISQAWRYLPGAYIGSWTFTDYRLVKLFGHFFNNIQMASMLWVIVAAAVLFIAKQSYDRCQVCGR